LGHPVPGEYEYEELVLQAVIDSNETGSFATVTSELCAMQNTDPSYRQRGLSTRRSKSD
jgi:hypothetical protein